MDRRTSQPQQLSTNVQCAYELLVRAVSDILVQIQHEMAAAYNKTLAG